MRPGTARFPALFTDEDVAALDREIEEALASGLQRRGAAPVPEGGTDVPVPVAERAFPEGLLEEGFFDEEAEADLIRGLPVPGPSEGARSSPQAEGDGEAEWASSAVRVAWMVPAAAFALGAMAGDLDDAAAWETAPGMVLALLLGGSAFGLARRATAAFAACVHSVAAARLAVAAASSPEAGTGDVLAAAAAWALLAVAAAWLALPFIRGKDARPARGGRRDPLF